MDFLINAIQPEEESFAGYPELSEPVENVPETGVRMSDVASEETVMRMNEIPSGEIATEQSLSDIVFPIDEEEKTETSVPTYRRGRRYSAELVPLYPKEWFIY